MLKATFEKAFGEDIDVVNAARVSFGKRKEVMDERDVRLLRYLAKHKHELPFAHVSARFHFKAPIFVARQLAKHTVGFVWSEISRRYVSQLEFWWPEVWRKANPDVKQGSLDEEIDGVDAVEPTVVEAVKQAVFAYDRLLEAGVCKEQARMVLPQNLVTEWIWTGSLLGWARVWGLRTKPDAQKETREIVGQLDEPLEKAFPCSWPVLKAAAMGQDV